MVECGAAVRGGDHTRGVVLENTTGSVDSNGDGLAVDSTHYVAVGVADIYVVVEFASDSLHNAKGGVGSAGAGDAEEVGIIAVGVIILGLLGVGLQVVPRILVSAATTAVVSVALGAADDLLRRKNDHRLHVVEDADGGLDGLSGGEGIATAARLLILDWRALALVHGVGSVTPVEGGNGFVALGG